MPEKISSLDVTGFVNANLDRLRGYVERELHFRCDSGQRRLAEVSVEEVIDEVIANALDEHQPRPEKIALEPWLYRLSRSAMDRLGNQLNSAAHSVRWMRRRCIRWPMWTSKRCGSSTIPTSASRMRI